MSKNFARTAQKLLRITPRHSRGTLSAFLTRYDVHNIKVLLLSKKLGTQKEALQSLLMPAGSMSQKELSAIVSAKGADEFYALLRGTEFGAKFFTSSSLRGMPKEQIKAVLQNPAAD